MDGVSQRGASVSPFNSALETGIRALVLLEAFYPRRCDLSEVTWLDHLVVHTGDISDDAPPSLHPGLPNRVGELLVRRSLVEHSLRLMQKAHLVTVEDSDEGIVFSASDEASPFLDLLRASYTRDLKQCAAWMAERFAKLSRAELGVFVQGRIGRWTAEFGLDFGGMVD
jgi:hypothetical protein